MSLVSRTLVLMQNIYHPRMIWVHSFDETGHLWIGGFIVNRNFSEQFY